MQKQCKYVFVDNNRTTFPCLHATYNNTDFCVFHDPSVSKKAASFNSAITSLIKDFESGPYETIDLRGFKFPEFDYHGMSFKKEVDFRHAEFYGKLNFDHVIFESRADFYRAIFHGMANFQEAIFQGKAQFDGAIFKQKTLFVGGECKEKILFHGCKFFEHAVFQSRRFNGTAIFKNNTFHKDVAFMNCRFEKSVDFSRTLFKSRVSFDNAIFSDQIILEESHIALLKGIKGAGLNFEGAVLESAYFREQPILEKYSFRNAFLISCNLSGKTLLDCDLTGAVLKAVYTAGWHLDEKTKQNTKYVFTDYETTEKVTQEGDIELKYTAVKESRVPVKGDFGDHSNMNYTILEFATEPYKWEYLLDLPEEIQTGIINYINFFRDYARVTTALDVGIATMPLGKKTKLTFLLEDEGKQEEVKLLLKQYLENIFTPFNQIKIDFRHSHATDHDRNLLQINYQNELLTAQARFIYALQDISLRRKAIDGISLVASEDSADKANMMRLFERLIDKSGSPQPILISAQATASNTTNVEISIENKTEIRISLAELYDEINEAARQSSNKSKITEILSEEIDSAAKDVSKASDLPGVKQRILDITKRCYQFAKKAVDYGIKNGDKIILICEKLIKLLENRPS